MSNATIILGYGLLITLFSNVFLVIFGQVSVRKFRKNPEVAPYLGISLLSGWDIINAASALASPLWLLEKLTPKHGDFINADYVILRKHASKLDYILARFFYYPFVVGPVIMLSVVILKGLGVFN